ncbi:MAG: ATP synthase F1 subunit delta [Eubacteriales bacterium]|nr:ATP synthase F1 subunit delta [Eubacteriales bacterium]
MTQTARLYGSSLYDLAKEEGLIETVRKQLGEIRRLFGENPDYLRLLGEPSLAKGERLGMIEEAFGNQAERYLVSFLKLLCERGLLGEFSGCCQVFTERYNKDHGITEAVAVSAVPLKKEQASALKERLEKLTGKKVHLTWRTDPRVLAGLRVEIDGKQFDGTVQGRLDGISRKLNESIT